MTVLGVTGCVGAGKSTVCEILRQAGWSVFDVDAEAAAAVPRLEHQLRAAISAEASLAPADVLTRLLTHPHEKVAIEAVLVPEVKLRVRAWRDALTGPGVIDAALLFEAGLDAFCDVTLCVTCDASVRRARVSARSSTSRTFFDAIEAAQLPEEDKARRAAMCISSNVSLETLHSEVARLVALSGRPR